MYTALNFEILNWKLLD